jgi:hypothetical protein
MMFNRRYSWLYLQERLTLALYAQCKLNCFRLMTVLNDAKLGLASS